MDDLNIYELGIIGSMGSVIGVTGGMIYGTTDPGGLALWAIIFSGMSIWIYTYATTTRKDPVARLIRKLTGRG